MSHRRATGGMTAALLLTAVVPAAASAQQPRSVVHGRTPGGIAWEAAGQGPPVVLIHGSNLDRRLWDAESAALAPRFRVIRFDLRAHGASDDITGPWSFVADLAEVMDAARAPRAALVGLSAGGQVALEFALAHPDRVTRLVLAAPGVRGLRMTSIPLWMEVMMDRLRAGDAEGAARTLADSPVMQVPAGRQDAVRAMVLENARLFRQNPALERPEVPDALARLGAVPVPTLILTGALDSPDLRRAADTLAAGIPNATRVVVPDAGHLLNLWAPETFLAELFAFLEPDRAPPRPGT